MDARKLGRGDDLVCLGLLEAGDVLGDRAGEELDVLWQVADTGAQLFDVPVVEFGAIQPDRTGHWRPDADQSSDQRGLAGATSTDDGECLAGIDEESNAVDDRRARARWADHQILDLQVALRLGEFETLNDVLDFREEVLETSIRLTRAADLLPLTDNLIDGLQGAAQTRATPQGGYLRFIKALVGQEVRFIPVDDVIYLEATDKYVNVVAGSGESLIRTSLRELLTQLDPEHFWQVHRGTVVNVAHVSSAVHLSLGRLVLKIRGRTETLPVARQYAHLFRQM